MSKTFLSKLVIVPVLVLALMGIAVAGAGAHSVAQQKGTEITAAAAAIGVAVTDLQTAQKNGQTIAQVAQAHNISVQAVIDAVTTALTNQAAARPEWAKMSEAQKARSTAAFRLQATNFVYATANGSKEGARPAPNADYQAAATAIGISAADLQAAVKKGQSIAQVAQARNVSVQTVVNAVVAALTSQAQARPDWAKLSEAQKTQALASIQTQATRFVNNVPGNKNEAARPSQPRTPLTVAAATIGVTTVDLQTAQKNGQTIAQVAQAHNVSPQTVITAIVNELTAQAQARPDWAKLSQAQKTQILTGIQNQATKLVNTITGDKRG